MSTRSFIGIQHLDGTVTGVYCHFDGYLDGVGQTLTESYTTPQQVLDLVALGSLSTLGRDTSTTVAYHRDRGEELDVIDYPKADVIRFNDGGYEFIYLFRPAGDGTYAWHYADRASEGVPAFKPLVQ